MAAQKSRKLKPFKLRRSLQSADSRSISEYARRTGEVIWAWNRLHYALQPLFVDLVTPTNVDAGRAIWNAVRSDSAQREILRAAPNSMCRKPQIIEGGNWLLDVTNRLAPHRNDAVHVPTRLNWTESAYVAADWLVDPKKAKRFDTNPTLRRVHRLLRDNLYVLTNYVTALWYEMSAPGEYGEIPPPPKLRSIPQVEIPQTRPQKLAKRTSGSRRKD